MPPVFMPLVFMPRALVPPVIFPAGHPGYTVRMIATRTGHELRAIEIGDSQAPAVVCAHGWGCSVYTYRHLLPAIAAAGYRAIAFDLLGHGLSDKPNIPALYQLDALTDQLFDLLDVIGVESVRLVGHSLGGEIVARAAALAPSRVLRLALVAPVGLGPVRLAALGRALTPAWISPALRVPVPRFAVTIALSLAFSASGESAAVEPRFTADDIDQYWAPTQLPGFTVAMRHLVHVFPWRLHDTEWLQGIATPTVVVVGTADRLVDPRSAVEYARAIPHALLRRVEGAGHAVTGRTLSQIDAEVLAFVTRAAPEGGPRGG
jgi:pimeloyl-ACP methyl ester carboxylesterase